MGFGHADAEGSGVVPALEAGKLLSGFGSVIYSVCSIYFLRDTLYALFQRKVPVIKRAEEALFLTSIHDGISKFQCTISSLFPVG